MLTAERRTGDPHAGSTATARSSRPSWSTSSACPRTRCAATCASSPPTDCVQRVHGGALPAAPPMPSFAQRLQVSREAKGHLAEAALPLLEGAQRDRARRRDDVARARPPAAAAARLHGAHQLAAGGGRARRTPAGRGRADRRAAAEGGAGRGRRRARSTRCATCAPTSACSASAACTPSSASRRSSTTRRTSSARWSSRPAEVIALATADKLRTAAPVGGLAAGRRRPISSPTADEELTRGLRRGGRRAWSAHDAARRPRSASSS